MHGQRGEPSLNSSPYHQQEGKYLEKTGAQETMDENAWMYLNTLHKAMPSREH